MPVTPTNRELQQAIESLDRRLFNDQEGFLPRIERQTVKTNGRVNGLEDKEARNDRRWAYVLGFCACMTIVVIPIAIAVVSLLYHIHAS